MHPTDARRLLMKYGTLDVFTRRQTEILRLLAAGKTVVEIAAELGIVPGTVAVHLSRAKMDVGVWEARKRNG